MALVSCGRAGARDPLGEIARRGPRRRRTRASCRARPGSRRRTAGRVPRAPRRRRSAARCAGSRRSARARCATSSSPAVDARRLDDALGLRERIDARRPRGADSAPGRRRCATITSVRRLVGAAQHAPGERDARRRVGVGRAVDLARRVGAVRDAHARSPARRRRSRRGARRCASRGSSGTPSAGGSTVSAAAAQAHADRRALGERPRPARRCSGRLQRDRPAQRSTILDLLAEERARHDGARAARRAASAATSSIASGRTTSCTASPAGEPRRQRGRRANVVPSAATPAPPSRDCRHAPGHRVHAADERARRTRDAGR